VRGILTNGFAFVPNRRELIARFVPEHDFGTKEPQQFGMVSFTQHDLDDAGPVRDAFGTYGIIVTMAWARSHQAQAVLYVPEEGPIFEAFTSLFTSAYRSTKERIPYPNDAFWAIAYTNRWSGLGAPEYAALLGLYEFMEPSRHSYQSEWRIAQKVPLSGYPETTAEVIANVSPPQGWAKLLNVITVRPTDVAGFVCPEPEVATLQRVLPEAFANHPINSFAG
jgi:hypothetical protein